jgi:hypothetical protein
MCRSEKGEADTEETGDHVDILGRASLNDLILRIAGGKGGEINETIHSNITQYAEKVKIWDDWSAWHDEELNWRFVMRTVMYRRLGSFE